jgi:hypothetical protein
MRCCRLIKAEPPLTRDVNRDSGTDSANALLRQWSAFSSNLVRPMVNIHEVSPK